ncbi:MAG: 4Fe-4S binding protein [Candidatus Omnitrophica bacterium]|nr:4Fe-4S binding protein [Candidatus Omnitrophota bacterium]
MVSKRIVLKFPHKLLDQPIVYKLVKDFDLVFNILQAKITPAEEGLMVLELKGKKENYAEGIKYLTSLGLKIQPLSQDVTRDESRCTHCGACISVCPTGALHIDQKTMKVIFDSDKCIACELCVRACPPRAMIVKF